MSNNSKRVALLAGKSSASTAPIAAALRSSDFDVAVCGDDISDADENSRIVANVRETFGRLDVLVIHVPAAEAHREDVDVLEATEERFDASLGCLVKSPYFLAQVVARWMVEQRAENAAFRGVIVFLKDAGSLSRDANLTAASITRAGSAMVAQLWAHRLAEFGISVFDVRTMSDQAATQAADGYTFDGRPNPPEDAARAVVALARGELSYATGNVLHIDGGHSLRRL